MKKATLTEDKAEKTPTGGVLVGKREGQTIIHNKGTLSGYLVGKTHAEGGIKAVNKSTGQPLEMQGGEVVITAPAVSDNTKNEFNGKMMTNREILSQINVKGGGVAFAKDGMEIPKSVKHTGASYNYGGKTMTDHEIIKHITGGHLAKGMTLTQIAKKHKVSLKELQKQVDMGMKAESEHTSSKREQMKIVKDHLYENPKYYSLLKKAGLNHGGRVNRGSLVRDAKSGNTPARDLNNYNDVLDIDADGMVGAETSLYADGGLIAPNGNKSNLTPEQYKLVRTPEFKAWFGDWENDPANSSKVVDDNGEPLVVYHGTYVENPFYIFDFDKADLGFHFGTYEQAKNRSETKLFFKGRKSIVNSFFLNIKTIFESTDIGEWEYPQRYIDMFVSDGLISESDAKKNGFYRLVQREENKQIREYLLNKYGKFGGFVYNNKYEGKGNSFIVLNPNQIKLADGSNTTFDGNNPDIRYADGGMFNTEPFLNYYFDEIAEFLKYQNNITLNKDFTFKYKGELFKVEPIVLSEKNIKEAYFSIIDSDNEEVGDIVFNPNNNKKFEANSDFFDWNNIKFYDGGDVKPYDANMEGDSVDMIYSGGGGVKNVVQYVSFAEYSDTPFHEFDKSNYNSFDEFKIVVKELYEDSGYTGKRKIELCVNNMDSIPQFKIEISKGRNTNFNFNPFTGTFKDLEKNLQKSSINSYDKFDWSKWSGVKSSTSTPSQTSVPTSKVLTKDEFEIDLFNQIDIIVKTNNIKSVDVIGWRKSSNSKDFIVISELTGAVYSLRSFDDKLGTQVDDINRDSATALLFDYKEWKAMQPTIATPTSANTKFFKFTGETLTEIPDSIPSFSGIIKDLPEKIKQLALQSQKDAGNTPNENLLIDSPKRKGNFDWINTGEGTEFWLQISLGNFEPFKKIYGDYGEGLTGINIGATPTSATIDLQDKKIWIGDNPDLSERIQEFGFANGYENYEGNKVIHTHRNCIFFGTKDGKKYMFILNDSRNAFDNANEIEIFESDLFGTATATPTSTIQPIEVTKLTLEDLTNSKIYLGNDPALCEKIQTVAFLLGLKWVDGDGRVSELDAECLFFDDSTINRMEFGNATKFAKSKFKQIYVVDSKTTAKTTSAPFDLTKTKIWIDNSALSEKVQKKAFELGWEWYGEDLKNVQDKGIPVALFFEDTKRIEWTDNKYYFDNETNDYKEIFESDIFGNSTSTASQTSTQNVPVMEDEDWVKKFTADLDKLVTHLPNDMDFAPQLSKEKKDLENLKKLLPSFQQKKYAIERAKILKEIKRLHNKLTYEGFIQGNEEGSTGADLFTPQGLLDYYYTQATQNPTADLDPPCELPTPNGEKSKLPMSAYLNVRTQQFKNWFGDWEKAYETGNYVNCSKMIDPDTKEPKIYFHGVRKYVPNFGQFSNMGQGVVRPYGAFEPPTFPASFFAGEEEYAKFYGGVAENMPTPSADYKPFIYKVFLSVKNPISLLPLDFMLSYKDFMDYIYVGYGVKVTPNQQLLTILDNDIIKKNPMWIYIRRDIGVIELFKDYGYDAIFQMGDIPTFLPNGEVEPDRTKHLQEVEYLTFYPNQVKSATVKKSFYFDFFNDIRFKNGGYVRI